MIAPKTIAQQITEARNIANALRSMWPKKAEEIDAAIEAFEGGKRDSLQVSASVTFKLEKFEGEITPGKQPYETIVGQG